MSRCPRCITGSLITRGTELICLSCGYEVRTIPQDVLDEIKVSHGRRRLKGSDTKLPYALTQWA